MDAKSNLLIFMEKQGIKKPEFYKKTGLSNGFLDKNENIPSKNIEIIISIFPEISLEWLITGKGEMMRTQRDEQLGSPDTAEKIESLRSAICDKEKVIEALVHIQQLLMDKIGYLEAKVAHYESASGVAAAAG